MTLTYVAGVECVRILLILRGNAGQRRSNPIGEDDSLEQNKQSKVEQTSSLIRSISRLIYRIVDYTVD